MAGGDLRPVRTRIQGPGGVSAESPAAVAFLASDDASFVNATSFIVDGGTTAAYVTAE